MGNVEAAREILADFVAAIDARSERMWPQIGPPIHWDYARYLADAFQKILDGADPALALGVKTSKAGRRPGKKTYDEKALAAAYWFLRRQGFASEKAIRALTKHIGADRRTIQRAAKPKDLTAYSSPELIEDDILRIDMRPYRAKIEAILTADAKD